LWHNLAQWITDYLPRDSRRMVFTTILSLTQTSTGFFSLGLFATIWTASSGFVSLMESLTVAYGAKEVRGFWKKRVLAIAATVVGAVFLLGSFGLLTFGHWAAAMISMHLDTVVNFQVPWEFGRWLASLLLMLLGLDLKEPSQIEAHVEIPTFNIRYQFANIALVRPLRLDYRGGIATLQQTEFKGTGTDVTLQGVIPVKSANTAFNLAANGSMDLSLLHTMTKGLKSSGRIELALTGRGADFKHPAMQGHLRIENAYLSTDLVPVGIEGVNGVLNISGNRIDIGQLTGTVGGGTLSAQGYMTYGSQASFNLGLQGKSIRVRYPEGLRSVVDCNLQLNGNEADSTLSGRVVIDRLSFT
jgi:hypothetical protein